MKITQSWKRNTPSTLSGESLTVSITYSSFNKEEIDELEERLPTGFVELNGIEVDDVKRRGDP